MIEFDWNNIKLSRRQFLKATALGAAASTASMFPVVGTFAKSDNPIKIGMIDAETGPYAALGKNEIHGAKMAVSQINQNGGILGRPVQLLVEDSGTNPAQGVQKARKLIHRDKVSFLMGAISSAVALSVQQTTHDSRILYVCTGGHAGAITGKSCTWNTFRTCGTSWEISAGNAKTLYDKFGGDWYYITDNYAWGVNEQADYTKQLTRFGGKIVGSSLVPLGTTDFSSVLIKAKAAKPKVIMLILGGSDMVDCLKQVTEFGINKQITIAGALMELEDIVALPKEARYGWYTMEWYWNQPTVAHVPDFVAAYKKHYDNKVPTARSWFGFASAHAIGLAANKAKSLDSIKVAKALEGLHLPPDVALQPGQLFYRAGDHQLMANMYPGHINGDGSYPNLFKVADVVPSTKNAKPAAQDQCKLVYPS